MKFLFILIGLVLSSQAMAANTCGIPDGKAAFTKANMQKFFGGKANWKSTINGSSNQSTSVRDGQTKINLNFGNIASSAFQVTYIDKETGKTISQTAPKSEFSFSRCKLTFKIQYKMPGSDVAQEFPVAITVSGAKGSERMKAVIGGFFNQTVHFAPANQVTAPEAIGPEVPPELSGTPSVA